MATAKNASVDQEKKVVAGIELLLKLTLNITKTPVESKFRTIRSTIPKIQSTLFALGDCVSELVQALGFMKVDADHYVFVGDYFKVLKRGQILIKNAVEPLQVKFMTPEEFEVWDHMRQKKADFLVAQAKKKHLMDEAKRMQANDRKEKAQEGPAKASVANKLNFGANTHVFKPPVEAKGG